MTESKVVVPMGARVAANHGYACTNSLKGTKDASDLDRLMCAVEEVFGWLDGELEKMLTRCNIQGDSDGPYAAAISDVRRMFRAPEPKWDAAMKSAEAASKKFLDSYQSDAKADSDKENADYWAVIVAAVREADAKAAMEQCNNAVNAMMGIPQKPQHLWTTDEYKVVAAQQASRQGANGIIDPQKCPHRWAIKTDYSTMDKVVYCELCEWEHSRTVAGYMGYK